MSPTHAPKADRRLTPANAHVAHIRLQGLVDAPRYVAPEVMSVAVPLTDIMATPTAAQDGGARERQVLLGERFEVLDIRDGWAYGSAARDGYCGYVFAAHLTGEHPVTHRISARASHLYPAPEVRAPAIAALSFGAQIHVVNEERYFVETADGRFVPKAHIRLIDRDFHDPATIAQLFFGTPYLWGGNSSAGIDCSGLVQASLLACGIACPGDADLQMGLGHAIGADEPLKRSDLIFWDRHVGIMVDADTLIHANGHHMAVNYEPIDKAIARIAAQGGGDVTARRRVLG